jgi:hypothetical protein
VTNYELIVELELRNSSGIHTPTRLDGTVPRSAFGAQPPENELALADDPLAEGARGRLGHVVPLNVLNISAAVTDEVMMQQAFRIEPRGAALDRNFAHQSCLYQITQIVVSSSF